LTLTIANTYGEDLASVFIVFCFFSSYSSNNEE